jgi:hypothetical protein
MLGEVYPGIGAAGSVLATTLQNGNPVIHPAVHSLQRRADRAYGR